jgi:predicted TIM-barrel fold metal-dependent hydrolase
MIPTEVANRSYSEPEYARLWATFEDDRAGVLTPELIGVERLMWGSDYPHTEGTFPRSREQIATDFAGIPEAEVSQMVAGNAARLYRLTA